MIVGLTGLLNAGKDTFALALQRALFAKGITAVIDSFAAPIRQMAQDIGFSLDRDRKETPVTFEVETLQARFQTALERRLGDYLNEDALAAVYAYTLDAIEDTIIADADTFHTPLYFISPRQFMQRIGTEGGRRHCDTLWTDRVRDLYAGTDSVVLIPDVRFQNEAKVVDSLVNVVRPSIGLPASPHVSEAFAASLARGEPLGLGLLTVVNTSLSSLDEQAQSIAFYIAKRRSLRAS